MESVIRGHIMDFFKTIISAKISTVSLKADLLHYTYYVFWMNG